MFTMPTKTFATLKEAEAFTRLAISPGIINKHLTGQQLRLLAELEEIGAVKYSASHSLLLSVPTEQLEEVQHKLLAVKFYILPAGNCAVFKNCDFCDGEKMETLPFFTALFEKLEGYSTKRRLRIGYNACASACYNAVLDDIALIVKEDVADIYAGAIQMGKKANAGQLLYENIALTDVEPTLLKLIDTYNHSTYSLFSTFIANGGLDGTRSIR
ncbi:sulfite reductase [Lysinibacillus piscis]|uniref:Nitrite reductase n=1 Tax=Lysinibacillus piscis TaxID=2518931 RepID=A0ABQ5NJ94_9BACI|nr:sulfite reductase [Lysinibacillus sp. KH24]GLC88440.1 hypothetical protein LYSBPC_15670 [Lysinibacillus sp. KH24]